MPTAAAACVKAGINQFLDRHVEPVSEAMQRGLLSEAEIDDALRGVFRVMIRLGLLDPPAEVTQKSIVLLENVTVSCRSIAVV